MVTVPWRSLQKVQISFTLTGFSMIRLDPSMAKVKPSATLAINELSAKMISEGKKVYKLGFGQSPFPVPKKIVNALKKNAHQKDYLPVQGLQELRVEVGNFIRRNYNLNVSAANVLVGPGSKELIYNFQVASAFDELLLPTPSWVSYEPQAFLNNHTVKWLPTLQTNGWKLQPSTLEEHCRENPDKHRVIILNYPSNPVGNTYTEEELKDLAHIFKKEGIVVIADEIYGEVHHHGTHKTIASFYPEGTIISTGLSKWAGAGGWRLGVFIFPLQLAHIQKAMAIVASETFTSVSAPIQFAAVEAYKKDESLREYLDASRRILTAVGQYVYASLTEIGVAMPQPEGGFYLYPNFEKWKSQLNSRGIYTSEGLCQNLLNDTGVALLPGSAFGHSKEYFTARLSYVDFNGEEFLTLLESRPKTQIDSELIEKQCPRISLAVKKIISWLTQP